jgi:hypothetical protein
MWGFYEILSAKALKFLIPFNPFVSMHLVVDLAKRSYHLKSHTFRRFYSMKTKSIRPFLLP